MASDGLANAKAFAAKLSIPAWLLYGGFVVAAISTFLTWVSVSATIEGTNFNEDVSPFQGVWVVVVLAVIATAAFLAWPSISGSQMPASRLIGLTVVIGILGVGLIVGFWDYANGLSELKEAGKDLTDEEMQALKGLVHVSMGPGMILYMAAVVAMVAGVVMLWRHRSRIPKQAY